MISVTVTTAHGSPGSPALEEATATSLSLLLAGGGKGLQRECERKSLGDPRVPSRAVDVPQVTKADLKSRGGHMRTTADTRNTVATVGTW